MKFVDCLLPDDSAFFIADVPTGPNTDDPVKWNPWNKVVQDHRDGTIDFAATNRERAARGLPVPWRPAMGEHEVRMKPVY